MNGPKVGDRVSWRALSNPAVILAGVVRRVDAGGRRLVVESDDPLFGMALIYGEDVIA
jgi:hypothetical protein